MVVVGSGIAYTSCAAAADSSEGGGECAGRVGNYQIEPITARGIAMGRWRLTPPGYWGRRLWAGRGVKDTSSVTASPCHLQLCTPQCEHWGALEGKANACGGPSSVSFADTFPPGGRLEGVRHSREKLEGCGGRSEKRLPWLGQAAASASAPVSVHAVLLTDSGDERLCPRGNAGNRCWV